MELEEKQKLLWEEHDPRFHLTLPIDTFPVSGYLDALKADGAKIIQVVDLLGKKSSLVNSIDLAKTGKWYVGILTGEPIDFATNQATLYVLQDGKAQALLTEYMTLSSHNHWNRQNHAHLELRDTYALANCLASFTMRQLQYVGNSPLERTIVTKR
jgi:hypothetical protein